MINVFCVGPQGLNVGNDVIAFSLQGLLRDAFDGSVNLIAVPACREPGRPADWVAGLDSSAIHEMNLYGHGVVIGGGNLYENGRLHVDTDALAALRPPLLLAGLSSGRVYDERHRLVRRTDAMPDATIGALNRKAVGSLVRDRSTVEHLRGLGLTGVALAACPSLLLSELPWFEAATEPAGPLISIRAPQLMSIPLTDRARVQGEIRAIARALEADGHGRVRLLCHDPRDLAFAASFGDLEYVAPESLWSYLDLLRRAPLVVTFRLHAFLPCLALGTPAVNISYDERSLSLLDTIGLADWDVNLVQEADVCGAVMDRVDRPLALAALVEETRPLRARLAAVLRDELARFAEAVRAHAATAERVG